MEQAPAPPCAETPCNHLVAIAATSLPRGDFDVCTQTPGNQMTTTVLELIENLKHYPGATEVTITTAVDDQEFAIVDFKSEANGLNIVIGSKAEEDEEEI